MQDTNENGGFSFDTEGHPAVSGNLPWTLRMERQESVMKELHIKLEIKRETTQARKKQRLNWDYFRRQVEPNGILIIMKDCRNRVFSK